MRAISQAKFGGPEVLEAVEISEPKPAAGEVLVQVKATSMNPLDAKIRSGALWFLTGRKFPKVLGCDVSGVVLEVGSGVTRFKKGDAVAGLISILNGKPGANCERVAVAEARLALKPPGVSFLDAAALPVGALTGWQVLKLFGNAGPGSKVLINGASGGVGTFAVQLGKLLGAEVTAVCSARNAELVRSLGATHVIDYATTDFRAQGAKYDVVFDVVHTAPFAGCRAVLARGGLWAGTMPSPAGMLGKVVAALLGFRVQFADANSQMAQLPGLLALVEQGKLKVVTEQVLPLAELAQAHRLSEAGRVRGKIVIKVAD